ncbi:deoxyribonuclease V [Pseudomonas sp. MWU13-3659]|uniref:deoxyribonuclease V n=1 Tax=Pseudomonas sp. MWU13-3659 TaxID=2986964 RepID=UPI00207594D1|nr:deoxyribonuclease V [Pseudomonas sp. MWU13-3659]
MHPVIQHRWDISPSDAITLQQALAKQVIKTDQLGAISRIAGIDVAYHKNNDTLIATIVVLDAETLEIIEARAWEDTSTFPYVPGLFSFRELPSIIKLLSTVENQPDLIICDGQGIAHPRRLGLASHLGVLFDIPTIGCGKSRYIGEYTTPAAERGARSDLIDGPEIIGAALRTQHNIKPVFVSIGHRISLATACQWVLKATPNYRLPETTRLADRYGRQFHEQNSLLIGSSSAAPNTSIIHSTQD